MAVCYSLKLSELTVSVPSEEAFQDELTISTCTLTLSLRASNEDVRNDWIEEINEAIGKFNRSQSTFGRAASANKVSQDKTIEEIGDREPVWFPYAMAAFCQVETCESEFSLFAWKQHCQCCGAVVCSTCSQQRAPLQYKNLTKDWVCPFCFKALSTSKTC